jgi:hypothetical protein
VRRVLIVRKGFEMYPTKIGDIVVRRQEDLENPFAYKAVTRIDPPRQGKTVEEGYGWTEVDGPIGGYGDATKAWYAVPADVLAQKAENARKRLAKSREERPAPRPWNDL